MAIVVTEINPTQVVSILELEEGHFVDLKSQDVSPAKLTHTIAAFANADGGELYIGIDEKEVLGRKVRNWRGFDDPEAANGHIQAFENLFPLGQHFSYGFLRSPERPGLVLQATVHKTPAIVEASDGVVYVRRGAQKIPLTTPEAVSRLKLDKGISSFETETIDVPLELVSNSSPILEFMLTVVPTAEPEEWLRKQLLIRGEKPTVACVLLFAEEPQAILPKHSGVKISRYNTSAASVERDALEFNPITVEGNLYAQIRNSVATVTEVAKGIERLEGKRLVPVSYPPEAIHEIVTNALIHRDYSIPTDVQVRVFNDRIEVESPGKLPGHVTPENIVREQFARNGALVRILNKFPEAPNKDVGEGLETAIRAMKDLKLKPPVVTETDSSVVVLLEHAPLD